MPKYSKKSQQNKKNNKYRKIVDNPWKLWYHIKAAAEKAEITPDMSTSDICDALKTSMTEIQIDGLTGTEMHWTAEGEPQKAPKAVEIKDGKYEMMQ